MNLQQALQQTDLSRLAGCAAHRHFASQDGRETVEMFLCSLCELEPDLHRAADLEKARKDWKSERFYSRDELAAMEPDVRKVLFEILSWYHPKSIDYTASPWAETLAAEVRMPDSFSQEEKLDFLAAVVLEMGYYGFTSNDHDRNVKRLETAMQRLDKMKNTDSWEIERSTHKATQETEPDEWVDSILQLQDTARMYQKL